MLFLFVEHPQIDPVQEDYMVFVNYKLVFTIKRHTSRILTGGSHRRGARISDMGLMFSEFENRRI